MQLAGPGAGQGPAGGAGSAEAGREAAAASTPTPFPSCLGRGCCGGPGFLKTVNRLNSPRTCTPHPRPTGGKAKAREGQSVPGLTQQPKQAEGTGLQGPRGPEPGLSPGLGERSSLNLSLPICKLGRLEPGLGSTLSSQCSQTSFPLHSPQTWPPALSARPRAATGDAG